MKRFGNKFWYMLVETTMRYLLICFALLVCGEPVSAEKLPKVEKIPAAPTAQQKRMIAAGIVLFGAGDFDKAIEKYQAVLGESPDEVNALYELGYTYFTNKDYKSGVEVARRGAAYQSNLLPQFYVLLGNSLDELGKRDEAIGIYRSAIKSLPGVALLHFNLGLTMYRSEKYDEARKTLQQAVLTDPGHASSHFLLGATYQRSGHRIPAILAYSWFLVLEPDSPRSRQVLPALNRLIVGGVSQGADPSKINITLALTPDSKKDEGDFGPVEVAMSMSVAAAQMGEFKEKSTPFKLLAATYGVMGGMMSNMKGKGFATKYYCPFFASLDKEELTEAFVYRAFQVAQVAGSAEWAKENAAKLHEYQSWVSSYQWPSKK